MRLGGRISVSEAMIVVAVVFAGLGITAGRPRFDAVADQGWLEPACTCRVSVPGGAQDRGQPYVAATQSVNPDVPVRQARAASSWAPGAEVPDPFASPR